MQGVNPRRPPVRVFANGVCHGAVQPSPLRQSRFLSPQAVGRRLCALPFRWSLPLSMAWNYLTYVSAPLSETLKIIGVGEKIPGQISFQGRGSWASGPAAPYEPVASPPLAASAPDTRGRGCYIVQSTFRGRGGGFWSGIGWGDCGFGGEIYGWGRQVANPWDREN